MLNIKTLVPYFFVFCCRCQQKNVKRVINFKTIYILLHPNYKYGSSRTILSTKKFLKTFPIYYCERNPVKKIASFNVSIVICII